MAITISNHDKGFLLESQMCVRDPISDVFEFFADARNLETLTPPTLHFRILTEGEIEMKQGTRIDYRLRVHGLPVHWQSEITAWEPPYRFVDEQRRGPYRWWIHEHRFEQDGEFTWVHDRVQYGVPGGRLVNRLLISRDLRKIFQYRSDQLRNIFATA